MSNRREVYPEERRALRNGIDWRRTCVGMLMVAFVIVGTLTIFNWSSKWREQVGPVLLLLVLLGAALYLARGINTRERELRRAKRVR